MNPFQEITSHESLGMLSIYRDMWRKYIAISSPHNISISIDETPFCNRESCEKSFKCMFMRGSKWLFTNFIHVYFNGSFIWWCVSVRGKLKIWNDMEHQPELNKSQCFALIDILAPVQKIIDHCWWIAGLSCRQKLPLLIIYE